MTRVQVERTFRRSSEPYHPSSGQAMHLMEFAPPSLTALPEFEPLPKL